MPCYLCDDGNTEVPAEAPADGSGEAHVEPGVTSAPPEAAPTEDKTAAPANDVPPPEGESVRAFTHLPFTD